MQKLQKLHKRLIQKLPLFNLEYGRLLLQKLTIPSLTNYIAYPQLLNNKDCEFFRLLLSPNHSYQNPSSLAIEKVAQQSPKNYRQPTIFSKFKAYYQQTLSSQQKNKTPFSQFCINNQLSPTQQ